MSEHPGWRRAVVIVSVVAASAIVLGGTAGAAGLITGAQIEDNTVHGRDITNHSVTGSDVTDGSVGPADYTGPVVGPPGAAGPAGPEGPAGFTGFTYRVSPAVALDPGRWSLPVAACPAGTKALSGGIATREGAAGTRVLESAPLNEGTGWRTAVRNEGSAWITVYAWVVCAKA